MHQIALSELIKVESGGTGQAVGQGGLRGSHAAEGRAKRDAKRNNQEIMVGAPLAVSVACSSWHSLRLFLGLTSATSKKLQIPPTWPL